MLLSYRPQGQICSLETSGWPKEVPIGVHPKCFCKYLNEVPWLAYLRVRFMLLKALYIAYVIFEIKINL